MDINNTMTDDLNPEKDIVKGIQKGGEMKPTPKLVSCLNCGRMTQAKNAICLSCQNNL